MSKPNKKPASASVSSSATELDTQKFMAAVGARIREVRGTREQKEFAASLGMVHGTYGNYERGEYPPSAEFCVGLALTYNISTDWLLTGTQPKEYSLHFQRHSQILEDQIKEKYLRSDSFVLLPLYDIRSGAGYSSLVKGAPPEEFRAFSREWLLQEVRVPMLERLALVTLAGAIVELDLHDGQVVMIDKGDTEVLRDGGYVFFLEGHVFVKKLSLRGDRLMIVGGDGEHRMQELKRLQKHVSFRVIGRVIGLPMFKRI